MNSPFKVTEGLKPCPFCGGNAEFEESDGSQASGFATCYRILCNTCGQAGTLWMPLKAEAAADWNTRHEAQLPLLEMLETLRDYISDVAGGHVTYSDIDTEHNAGVREMAVEDLTRLDALLAQHKDSPDAE